MTAAPGKEQALERRFAALLAGLLGIALAWILTLVLLDVEFSFRLQLLLAIGLGAIVLTGLLGAVSIRRALAPRPALLLRAMN